MQAVTGNAACLLVDVAVKQVADALPSITNKFKFGFNLV
jgi:hypothetical protein